MDHQRALPTDTDSRAGAVSALANARTLLKSAEALADIGLFGPACSLLVLAFEEAVKSRVLLAMSLGIPLPIRDLLFRHQMKHGIAAITVLLEHVMTSWIEMISALLAKYPEGSRGNEYRRERAGMVKGFVSRLEAMADGKAIGREVEVEQTLEWLNHADDLKMMGLYVDFQGGTWASPSDVGEEQFTTSLSIVSSFVDNTAIDESAFDSIAPRLRSELPGLLAAVEARAR